jgi:hypothetical protein
MRERSYMLTRNCGLTLGSAIVFSALLGVAAAEDSPSSIEDSKLKAAVVDWKPQTKAGR